MCQTCSKCIINTTALERTNVLKTLRTLLPLEVHVQGWQVSRIISGATEGRFWAAWP